ncbi:hypothetical protein CAK95_26600 [Pseudorhodoplanes sinuspersici]|uniref:Uncharacterized protein n=1 Tax=Pseudorhodoplanes sinuspersici TaxID=1235591 RepID=A0A1W6ZY03_9HYPH|nr:hypothetical protein CAK95_26600 [Pseudorhodoplanes sinuspersici]
MAIERHCCWQGVGNSEAVMFAGQKRRMRPKKYDLTSAARERHTFAHWTDRVVVVRWYLMGIADIVRSE